MAEESMELDRTIILNEVIHGCELAKDLQNKLDSTSPSQPHLNDLIAHSSAEIVTTFSKVLELLGGDSDQFTFVEDIQGSGQSQPIPITSSSRKESPPTEMYGGSPLRKLSISAKLKSTGHAESSEKEKPILKQSPEKRKSFPRWTLKLPAAGTSETGPDGPPDDGYSWRKYGQKDILGSQYPRSYYRCTHKTDMDCRAKKQVQRAYDDPSYFEVTYIGVHCCHINPHILDTQTCFGVTQMGSTGIPTIPNALLFGGSQPESSTVHGLLSPISGEASRHLLSRDPAPCKEEVEKTYDFGKHSMFSYTPDLIHMAPQLGNPADNAMEGYYRFASRLQQDASSNRPANMPVSLFREEKNLIDFLPPQAKEHPGPSCSEGELSLVSFFGPSVGSESSFMDVMDSGESVSTHMQTSKSEFTDVVSGEASPPMLDIDVMFHTDDLSELQLGEKLPWNIKKP